MPMPITLICQQLSLNFVIAALLWLLLLLLRCCCYYCCCHCCVIISETNPHQASKGSQGSLGGSNRNSSGSLDGLSRTTKNTKNITTTTTSDGMVLRPDGTMDLTKKPGGWVHDTQHTFYLFYFYWTDYSLPFLIQRTTLHKKAHTYTNVSLHQYPLSFLFHHAYTHLTSFTHTL